MARLEQISELVRKRIEHLDCPTFETFPWAEGPPLNRRRVAIISTAGIHRHDDRPFTFDPNDCYRIIPGDIRAKDLVTTHVGTNFDHTGFQQDWNVLFPIDRLKELAEHDIIGSVADFHYSFMGAHDPMAIEQDARNIAGLLKRDQVDAAILLPV